MIFRVAAIARARGAAINAGRRLASSATEVSTATAGGGSPLNAFARGWYNLFGSSTIRYATFFTVGAVLAELGTNSLTDTLWEANNKGKTYGSVDWSKFDPQDEDEEEDEDDDDDDDDDDE